MGPSPPNRHHAIGLPALEDRDRASTTFNTAGLGHPVHLLALRLSLAPRRPAVALTAIDIDMYRYLGLPGYRFYYVAAQLSRLWPFGGVLTGPTTRPPCPRYGFTCLRRCIAQDRMAALLQGLCGSRSQSESPPSSVDDLSRLPKTEWPHNHHHRADQMMVSGSSLRRKSSWLSSNSSYEEISVWTKHDRPCVHALAFRVENVRGVAPF
jgi:hypothetical protein